MGMLFSINGSNAAITFQEDHSVTAHSSELIAIPSRVQMNESVTEWSEEPARKRGSFLLQIKQSLNALGKIPKLHEIPIVMKLWLALHPADNPLKTPITLDSSELVILWEASRYNDTEEYSRSHIGSLIKIWQGLHKDQRLNFLKTKEDNLKSICVLLETGTWLDAMMTLSESRIVFTDFPNFNFLKDASLLDLHASYKKCDFLRALHLHFIKHYEDWVRSKLFVRNQMINSLDFSDLYKKFHEELHKLLDGNDPTNLIKKFSSSKIQHHWLWLCCCGNTVFG